MCTHNIISNVFSVGFLVYSVAQKFNINNVDRKKNTIVKESNCKKH